jgi:hypothetical protein
MQNAKCKMQAVHSYAIKPAAYSKKASIRGAHNAAMRIAAFALSAIGYRLSAIFTLGGHLMPTKRPRSTIIKADRAVIVTLQEVSDYAPTNPAYSLAALRELLESLTQAQETELRAKRAFQVACEQADELATRLHRTVLEVKIQVMAQYGSDSPMLHAVGRKQRSERKRPVRTARRTASVADEPS